MNGYSLKSRLLASSVFAGAALGLAGAPALAQEDEEAVQETVTVTGSRIQRLDFVSNSPIATVGAEQFELTGTVNTEGLLNTLPQTVPGLDRTSNNPGNGTATVDLRGLGAIRTLVLVDGKRIVPTTGGGVVDINNIPAALIERVEVVTGGASAVYGSDAIAGVVNFILKDDFEGVEASAGYEVTQEGDADLWSAALTMGGNYAEGRGNAVISLGYNSREELFQGDRDFAFFAQFDDGAGNLFDGGSSGVPQGAIFGGASFDFPDGTSGAAIFEQDGSIRLYDGSVDAYNYAPVNYIQLPQERFQVTAKTDYDINEDVTVYASALFANNDVPQQLAPTPIFQSGTTFSLDGNPFITPDAQAIISAEIGDAEDTDGDGISDTATVGGFGIRRRLEEVGPRISDDEFTALQLQAGITVDLTDTWTLDAYFQEGRVKNSTAQIGNVNRDRFEQALLLADADGDGNVDVDANGNPTCSDGGSNGSTIGCTPLNIFGEGNISEDAAAFLRTAVVSEADYEVTNFVANITGDTSGAFELPGGPIGLAGGIEYREEVFAFRPSQDLAAGTIAGFNGAPAVSGQFDVYGIYGEAYLPIISEAAYADLLAFELAYRY
ncbi:MAG: TonB-dependent receptor plug domain-containing protein, partial [Pseudomonadota bacterium]